MDYSKKYSSKIQERFRKGSITDSAAGHNHDWVGAKTVAIYSMVPAELTAYGRGSTRFGTITDLDLAKQEMTCSQTGSFIKHLETLDNSDVSVELAAGKFLRMEIDEKVNPTMDKYRLKKWLEGAATLKQLGSASTKSTIVGNIMDLAGAMGDNLAPDTNRKLFVKNSVYILLKQADAVVGIDAGDYNRKAVEKGVVGTFDGMKVIPVPSSWLPSGAEFMIKCAGTSEDPVKLAQYDVIPKTAGYSGAIAQGLVYYDAFVIGEKNVGIGVSGLNTCVLSAPTITISSHTMGIAAVTGAKLVYTLDGSDPRWSPTAVSGTVGGAISGVTTTAGTKVRAIAVKDGCVGIEATATDS